MTPAGYMAKRVSRRPEWMEAARIADIYSVSGCVSACFADYIAYWKHNGYWLFDSPGIILRVAREHSIDLSGMTLFYYEMHELEFHDRQGRWEPFAPETSLTTRVATPGTKSLEGYDVVTFCAGTSPECSPLSCNGLAKEVQTNPHCLLPSLERARELLEAGCFRETEPGPFRIFTVYSVAWS